MKALFGYGSIVLPMSTVGRFDEELCEITEEIRDNCRVLGEFLDFYLEKDITKRNLKLIRKESIRGVNDQ